MARTVNQTAHARRRGELVDAVFRIVSRDGIEHVSVRNVAREAGLSSGTLRHYFETQADLLAFALGEVDQRMRARLASIVDGQPPVRALERVLHQLVPLTPESVVDHQIWFAFVAKAITDPALQPLSARVYDDLRDLLRRTVQSVLAPEDDLEMEVERLYALVDGLVLHAALRPEQWSPERLTRVLSHHVESLAKPPRDRR